VKRDYNDDNDDDDDDNDDNNNIISSFQKPKLLLVYKPIDLNFSQLNLHT
jgi:hypothetical protein